MTPEGGNRIVPWLIIILGGFFQVGWSVGLNYTDGMTNILWDAIVIVCLVISMLCLSVPMKKGIPMGTAYAVWIGIGVILTIVTSAAIGLEEINIGMVAFMLVAIVGIVGLKMSTEEQ